jgi:hypothetical protein
MGMILTGMGRWTAPLNPFNAEGVDDSADFEGRGFDSPEDCGCFSFFLLYVPSRPSWLSWLLIFSYRVSPESRQAMAP